MQERYTKLAQRVIKRAKDISRQLGHNYVGSEHLLVGLSDVENGVASVILSKHNIEKDKLVEMICQYIMPQNKDTTVAEAGKVLVVNSDGSIGWSDNIDAGNIN